MKAKWARAKKLVSSTAYKAKYGRDKRLVQPGQIFSVDHLKEGEQQMLVKMGAIELLPTNYTPDPAEIAPQDTAAIAAISAQKKPAVKSGDKPEEDRSTRHQE